MRIEKVSKIMSQDFLHIGYLVNDTISADIENKEVLEFIADGGIIHESGSEEYISNMINIHVSKHLDIESRSYGYDNIDKARAVASSSILEWQEDGVLFNKLYDDCWTLAIAAQENISNDFNMHQFKESLPIAQRA